jgi:hypothetical protein
MINDLTAEQKTLADLMSKISEHCYSAGWMGNLEYVLWDALTSGPRKYGHGIINQSDISELKKISEKANSWIYFDDETEETGLSLSEWTQKFKNTIAVNPEVLS